MAVTKVGIVYYADDPEKKIFRVVYPELDDKELDETPTDGFRRPMLDEQGKPHQWHTFNVDPSRKTVLEKIPANQLSKRNLTGTV